VATPIYLETSILSYFTAPPSRDLLAEARRVATQIWWEEQLPKYSPWVSDLVVIEAARGHTERVNERLRVIQTLPRVAVSREARVLALSLLGPRLFPDNAIIDAGHLAIATLNRFPYLLTWNFRHLANARLRDRVTAECQRLGHAPPIICTPDELGGL
jgi:hypothetical protein